MRRRSVKSEECAVQPGILFGVAATGLGHIDLHNLLKSYHGACT